MELKDVYLKKIGRHGPLTAWLVNGGLIRANLAKEFTNFGQHFRFSIIPEYELWIDNEAVQNERDFFVDHLLIEWRLMRQGKSYLEACETADAKEKAERQKTKDLKKISLKNGLPSPIGVHLRLLDKISVKNNKNPGVSVWLVDGRLVRSAFNVEFTEGGHDLVYRFVPKNEVWIDNDILPAERPYIILHELYERDLMAAALSYPRAHRRASVVEWESRHNDKKLNKNLRLFGVKNICNNQNKEKIILKNAKRSTLSLIHPAIMWSIIIIGWFFIWQILGIKIIIANNLAAKFLFLLAVIYWLYFFTSAIRTNNQVAKSVAAVNDLVTVDVYGLIRHPIYSADIVLGWGIFLFLPAKTLFFCALWLTVVLIFWAKLEELGLAKKFGGLYKNYKKQVPMFNPNFYKIFKKNWPRI